MKLYIDPAADLNHCACALFDGPQLAQVGFYMALPLCAIPVHGGHDAEIMVERPEYQGQRSDAARVQDLLDLAWTGARLAYAIAGTWGLAITGVCEVTPSQWKGSIAKPPHHARNWSQFTAAEQKLFPAGTGKRIDTAAEKYALSPGKPGASYYGRAKGSEVHNLLDAAIMGLWANGRAL